MAKKKNRTKNGYSLIEVLLVTVVIMISFTAIFALSASLLKSDTETRNEILATNLAQEGMEMVKNIRDTNMLNDPDNWKDGLAEDNYYIPIIDSSLNVVLDDGGSSDLSRKYVYFNAAIGDRYFNCTSGCSGTATQTIFQRWINITDISSDEIEVTSYVQWKSATDSSLIRKTEMKARLTNWQP